MLALHYREGKAFAQLLRQARPVWLLAALLLQMATYATDARIWQRVIGRANISRPLRSYVGLGLAKLFMDQAIPSVGLSGTLLVIRALDRRGVQRGASMAAVVLDLVGYYAAYVLALGIALVIVWVRGELTPLMAVPAGIFTAVAAAVPVALLWVNRGRTLPGWLKKLPFIKTALQALVEATPAIVHDVSLIVRCTGLHLAIHALDAGTLWVMLRALGFEANPAAVFASFMLSTLAQTLGVSPGGLGVFEAVSVATLKLVGVPVAAGLEATLLFRFFTFWLPMAPGLILARREAKA
jgi:Mg2+-importing ATPase